MLHLICLTKSYRIDDFECWVKWHTEPTTKIHILDNESSVEIYPVCKFWNAEYKRISGFPNQWSLFSTMLNNPEIYFTFAEDDIVAFIDDDEFLWYDRNVYSSLECALRANFNQLGCLLIPEILMGTHHLQAGRNGVLPEVSYYRRGDLSSQGKSAILWAPWNKYSFNHEKIEIGHVPWINGRRFSDVVGSGVSKTTYGLCDYEAPVRLYHYHIKSENDWTIKIQRGSAAVCSEPGKNGSYDADITKDKKFGGYDIPDFTMKHAWESLCEKSQ